MSFGPQCNVFLILVIACMASSDENLKSICDESLNLLECMKKFPSLSNDGATGIPSSKAKVDDACSSFKSGVQCVNNYSEACVPPSAREIINKNMEGAKKAFTSLCDDSAFQKEYLKHGSCYDAVSKDWENCSSTFNEETTETIPSSNKTIIKTCCAKYAFFKCIQKAGEEKCDAGGTVFLRKMADTLTSVQMHNGECFPEDSYDEHCRSRTDSSSLPNLFFLLISMGFYFYNYF